MPLETPRTMGGLMDPVQEEPHSEPENTDGEITHAMEVKIFLKIFLKNWRDLEKSKILILLRKTKK